MVASLLLDIGYKSLDRLALSAERRRGTSSRHHPLAAYPRLQVLLNEAEKSGSLAAERRRLLMRRLSA